MDVSFRRPGRAAPDYARSYWSGAVLAFIPDEPPGRAARGAMFGGGTKSLEKQLLCAT